MTKFIILQKEHMEDNVHQEELIIPIDRIKEVNHLDRCVEDPDVRDGYRWKYSMSIASLVPSPSKPYKEIITLRLTEEGYNYVKGVLSSL